MADKATYSKYIEKKHRMLDKEITTLYNPGTVMKKY